MTPAANTRAEDRDARLAGEQAALRRVATLVAKGSTAAELFAAVAQEIREVLGVGSVTLDRYEPDRSTTVLASLDVPGFPVGSRWPLDGPSLAATVLETAHSARIDDYSQLTGTVAAAARDWGLSSTVGVPILVDGSVWGIICAAATEREPLPADAESRLNAFTELVATAISNAEYRDGLSRLVEEQAALRRVATLVAEGPTAEELFAAVVEEASRVLGLPVVTLDRYEPDGTSTVLAGWGADLWPVGSRWPLDGVNLASIVRKTGRSARIDDYTKLPGTIAGVLRRKPSATAVGVPIVVEGEVWGMIGAGTAKGVPVPADAETRLGNFTELVATAISNADSRTGLRRLADEQAALRRVATLVAEGATASEVFLAVAREVAQVLDLRMVTIDRYDSNATSTVLASLDDPAFPVGSRWPLDGPSLAATVFETGRPARIDDYSDLPGSVAAAARSGAVSSTVGVPISVDGKAWGVICVGTKDSEPLPPDTEARLAGFTELIATAIANSEARDDLGRLADEQAALRRVATLVAEGAAPERLFAAVAEEVAQILDVSSVGVVRYESDTESVVVASFDDPGFPVGSRWPIEAPSLNAAVFETGRPARIDHYSELPGPVAAASRASGVDSSIGVPIIVNGGVWGMITVGRRHRGEVLAAETDSRLAAFTELVATAIANAQAHDDLRRLAEEQAALRRVATLVAKGATAAELFSAVAREVAHVLDVPTVTLDRYDSGATSEVVGAWGDSGFAVGTRWSLEGASLAATVFTTGRPARLDDYSMLPGSIAAAVRGGSVVSTVGVPIVVDGQVWGLICVGTSQVELLPADAEARLARFTELVATAVSNATTRADLISSRARIVAAGDEARRKIERNLHDGTQQRLIAIGLDLQAVRAGTTGPGETPARIEQIEHDVESVLEDVRELSRGLHPALLARGGLGPSLKALARRSPIPVTLDVDTGERPPESIEIGVYYVVSEALTNAAKHSRASEIAVRVAADGPVLRATIEDDGVGGAEASSGSGLIGLVDRVEALGGRFALESLPGHGTRISIELPLPDRPASGLADLVGGEPSSP